MNGPGAPSLQQPPEHVGRVSAAARRVVHLLLGHALVDEARRALRLVLRVVPSAGPPQARSGALGAAAGAGRAAAVIDHVWAQSYWPIWGRADYVG